MSEIEQLESVLSRYWDKKLPVDILSIVNAIGVDVYPHSDREGRFYGSLLMGGRLPVVYLNTEQPLTKQRQVLAHLLARYLIGDDGECGVVEYSYNSANYTLEAWALELLTPSHYIEHLVIKRGVTSIADLADRFAVTYSQMKTRLIHIGLL